MYHLETILHLMISHQLDRWYKPKKGRGPKTDPWGTHTFTPAHEETCPFKVTIFFLFFKKSDEILSSLLEMPFCFSLKVILLCQTLSNVSEISRKTPLKRLIYFVGYRLKLVNTGVSWFEIRLVWGNQIVFNKRPECFIKYKSLKYFSANWKQLDWSVIFQAFFITLLMNWDYIGFSPF